MRLIDSDKIMYSKSDCNLRPFDYAFRAQLEALPAVDAVPVVHGEIIWKNRKKLVKRYDAEPCCFDAEANPLYHATNKHITEKVAYCPVCKKRMDGDFLNFCDNCGARMDGKDDDK